MYRTLEITTNDGRHHPNARKHNIMVHGTKRSHKCSLNVVEKPFYTVCEKSTEVPVKFKCIIEPNQCRKCNEA